MITSATLAGRTLAAATLLMSTCATRVGGGESLGDDSSEGSAELPGEDTSDEPSSDDAATDSDGWIPDGCSVADSEFRCTPACVVLLQDCPFGEKCTPFASTGGTWDSQKCVPLLGGAIVAC